MTALFQEPRCPYQAVDDDYCNCGKPLHTSVEWVLGTCETCALDNLPPHTTQNHRIKEKTK